jgi:hypothetical protein
VTFPGGGGGGGGEAAARASDNVGWARRAKKQVQVAHPLCTRTHTHSALDDQHSAPFFPQAEGESVLSNRAQSVKNAMPVDTPVSWEQARAYIDEGTVESLAKLGRNEAQLAEYRSAMDEVLGLVFCWGKACIANASQHTHMHFPTNPTADQGRIR